MLTEILSNNIVQALSWTLIHSIWQMSLVALSLALFLNVFKQVDSTKKYYIAFGSMAFSVLVACFTFLSYYQFIPSIDQDLSQQILIQAQVATNRMGGLSNNIGAIINDYNFIIVNAWLLGSILFLLRFLGGYLYLRHIVKNALPGADRLMTVLKRINKKYRINRIIRIKESSSITTPMVVGYIKPVILFPVGLALQLSVSEVEAIIAHELAHIKRHDYLLNIVQLIAESIFYYHPAMWYMSSQVRTERENCCDDMAIKVTNSSMSYARTLIKLQEYNMKNIQPALAMASNKRAFSDRIHRIIGAGSISNYTRDKFVLLLMFISAGCMYASDFHNANHTEDDDYEIYVIDDCPQSPEDIKFYLDTIPQKNFFKIKKQTNDQDIELEMEDGEISKLIIDGKKIAPNDFKDHESIVEKLKPNHSNEIITLFPECDDQLGQIYYLDQLGDKVINLDSLVAELKNKTGITEGFDYSFLDFNTNLNLEQVIIDTVVNRLKDIQQFRKPLSQKSMDQIDSVEKLIIEKYDFPFSIADSDVFNFNPNPIQGFDIETIIPDLNFESVEIFKNDEVFDISSIFKDNQSLFSLSNEKQTVSDIITSTLINDEIIDLTMDNEVEMTGKYLKINGEKQPSNLWKKYKKIYERSTGITLQKNSKLHIGIASDPNTMIN